MTTQQDLRERIAQQMYFGWVGEHGYPNGLPTWDELPDESPNRRAADPLCKLTWRGIAGFVEPLIPSAPDTGLASVVGEIERLFDFIKLPLTHERIHTGEYWICAPDNSDHEHRGETEPVAEMSGWGEDIDAHAKFFVMIANNWPRIRQALTTGGSGWRPISEAPKDGTHFLAGQWFVDGGKPEFHCAVTWWSHTWGFGGDTRVENPTHWMPLPPEPETGGG